ncbi:MAG: methylated-DNA--[protein]-cysteine S-methyltransferase [Myxococcota bacterium]
MARYAYALFNTALGRCGIGWSERGVALVQLPEANESLTRARISKRLQGAEATPPPPSIAAAIEAIQALLRGEPRDLAEIELDMDGVPDFHQRVYRAARRVGPGKTISYGEIARRIGSPGSARAVGQALGRNPFAIVVPCHRVLAAGGVGGFSANGGTSTKLRMLSIEGAVLEPDRVVRRATQQTLFGDVKRLP